ncbi:PPOX class F420-dependent oxidoreductase [Miniimonas arenae]|uniref:PPOX class F420-dependent oxidoreductase n=1 Tax=Miniimonas arenae TaxID=676201 RepID=UPI0028A68ABC|nr:PPOX class F420-dependent oxidoreductase [Miniimonas arenae]
MAQDDTPTTASWTEIARSPFVSLGTYRHSGELVETPVWVALEGGEMVVTTDRTTGKVKRLRHDPRVVLRPCSRMGAVAEDAPTVHGTARILPAEDPAAIAGEQALRRTYGLQYRLLIGGERLLRRLRRKPDTRVILRLAPATPSD